MERQWLLPHQAYQRACALVSRHSAAPKGLGDAEWPDEAIKLLRRADVDPELRKWRPMDPQLKPLRNEPKYQAEFGADPKGEDAFLSLPALQPFRKELTAIAATTARALQRYSDFDLATLLGVQRPAAREIGTIARLARSASEQQALATWSIDITDLLLQQGVSDVAKIPDAKRAEVARRVDEGLEQRGLASRPRSHDLWMWIAPGTTTRLERSASEQQALATWSIDITDLLLQQGVSDVDEIPGERRAEVARRVDEGLAQRGFKSTPASEALREWIETGRLRSRRRGASAARRRRRAGRRVAQGPSPSAATPSGRRAGGIR